MENVITLLPLFFLISILFLKTNIRTLNRTELARLVVGTIFLVIGERAKRAGHSQVCTIEIWGYIYTRKNGSQASEPTPSIFVFTLGGWRFQKIIET